ncbi:C2 family cysteine protease, partial [Paraburkholderia heleia]|uniref:C2 family cysteine protease n=1 Tax=Paraburkholderia heleia TaxID=634127 RepID=UPI002AB648AF
IDPNTGSEFVTELSGSEAAGLTAAQLTATDPNTGGELVADLTTPQFEAWIGAQENSTSSGQNSTTSGNVSTPTGSKGDPFGNGSTKSVTRAFVQAFTNAKISRLPAGFLNAPGADGQAILTYLTAAQIPFINPTQIPLLNPASLTTAIINVLSATQIGAFTQSQEPMVDGNGNVLLLDLAASPNASGLTTSQLSFANIDAVLQSVDNTIGASGLSASTLTLLGSLENATQAADGTKSATACLLDNMVDELTVGTSRMTFLADLNLWFNGGIDPALPATSNDAAAGSTPLNLSYANFGSDPLFLPNQTAQYLDIAQGNFGSCYLIASLIEDALQNPADLQNLITKESNGTYAVRFYGTNGVDYVDVNANLPVNTITNANGTSGSYFAGSMCYIPNSGQSPALWVGLVEKAYVEWCNAEPGEAYAFNPATQYGNSYTFYAPGGWGEGMESLTGLGVGYYGLSSTALAASTGSTYQALVSAWSAHQLVMFGCTAENASSIGLVKGHAFAFDGFDPSGNILLINPWGSASTNSQVIALSVNQLLSLQSGVGQGFYIANGSQSNPPATGSSTGLAGAPLLIQAMASMNAPSAASTTGAATAANLLAQSTVLASPALLRAA